MYIYIVGGRLGLTRGVDLEGQKTILKHGSTGDWFIPPRVNLGLSRLLSD